MDGKHQLCEICGTRLSRTKRTMLCGIGRRCNPRCKCPPSTTRAAPAALLTPTPRPAPRPKRKRPIRDWDAIGPAMKRRRITAAVAYLSRRKVPIAALAGVKIKPAELLHLRPRDRQRIRSVGPLRALVPSEPTINKLRRSLLAIRTATFATGAYIRDPLLAIRTVTSSSPFLCVGGDGGGGSCKLGATYETQAGLSRFFPILVLDGSDHYDTLKTLAQPDLTPFDGESAEYHSIFDIFQHLVHTHPRIFFHGDWLFVNAVLGLKSAASNRPCPICKTHAADFLKPAEAQKYRAKEVDRDRVRTPLLLVEPRWIVPLPLHLLLGIGNRIIGKALPRLFGQSRVDNLAASIKQTHGPGTGGRADFMALNGPEINKWIKKKCTQQLLDQPTAPTDATTRHKARLLDSWLVGLQSHLLSKNRFDRQSLASLTVLIDDIHARWVEVTGDTVFPKLHMLFHAKSFAEQHGWLGRYSEAPIESCHAAMNPIIFTANRNCGSNTNERLRRALADTATTLLQPLLL